MSNLRFFLALVLVMFGVSSLSACDVLEGAKEDVTDGADADSDDDDD